MMSEVDNKVKSLSDIAEEIRKRNEIPFLLSPKDADSFEVLNRALIAKQIYDGFNRIIDRRLENYINKSSIESGAKINNGKSIFFPPPIEVVLPEKCPFWISFIFSEANKIWLKHESSSGNNYSVFPRKSEIVKSFEYSSKKRWSDYKDLTREGESVTKITKHQATVMESMIRPVWARRSARSDMKFSRKIYVTPEVEKISLVLSKIEKYKQEMLKRPTNEIMIKWLMDEVHFSLSENQASVVCKLINKG